MKLNRSLIKEIFMKNGFTIKEGQTDLKEYVYEAAEALIQAFIEQDVPQDTVTMRTSVSKNPDAAISIINRQRENIEELKRQKGHSEEELQSFKEQFWWWQNDSTDNVDSMVDGLMVAIKAGDLRNLINSPNKKLVVTDEMVGRFLGWKLPDDFSPDCYIRFDPPVDTSSWPSGTNLFDFGQAKSMLKHVLGEGDPLTEEEYLDLVALRKRVKILAHEAEVVSQTIKKFLNNEPTKV
jgi:hypothetical protein